MLAGAGVGIVAKYRTSKKSVNFVANSFFLAGQKCWTFLAKDCVWPFQKRVQKYILMRLFQGDAEHGVPVRTWHWPSSKQETSRHSHVSGTQSATIQPCFRYTKCYHSAMFQVHKVLPFSHVSGTQSATIQPCFRYTALPLSHVSGTQHYHSVMFQIHSTIPLQ